MTNSENKSARPRAEKSSTSNQTPTQTLGVIQLQSLQQDQETYLEEIRQASSDYDRTLVLGGARSR